jgi:hypothetical protein
MVAFSPLLAEDNAMEEPVREQVARELREFGGHSED